MSHGLRRLPGAGVSGVPSMVVRYVNGNEIEAAPSGWPILRGDGVDYAELRAGQTGYRIQGRSVYWLRRDGELWIVGGGTVTDIEEAVALPDGQFEVRHPQHMPDLAADRVKFGWWY